MVLDGFWFTSLLKSNIKMSNSMQPSNSSKNCPSNSGINIQNSGELTKPSKYFILKRVEFTDNGTKRFWDYTKSHNSVAICIYNKDLDQLVFVRQFRPALLMETLDRDEPVENFKEHGLSVECCAGIVDKNKPIAQVAAEEVFEETGYKVDADKLEQFGKFRRIDSGAYQNMFYVEVTNKDRVGTGGGLVEEHESIEVLHLTIDQAKKQFCSMDQPEYGSRGSGASYMVMWFLMNKYNAK